MLKKIKSLVQSVYFWNVGKFTNQQLTISGVEIGDYTYGTPKITKFTNKYKVKIGKFCSISANVRILLDANHHIDWVTTYPLSLMLGAVPNNYNHPIGKGNVIIGNDVWIGRDVLIMSGVTIGDGAVIAAGSVVTKKVADYEIVGGNPAKHIRFRFSEEQIFKLKEIKWWNWDIEKIKENFKLLEADNVDKFIKINAI